MKNARAKRAGAQQVTESVRPRDAPPSQTSTLSRRTSPIQAVPRVAGLTILSHPMARRIGELSLVTALSSGREAQLSRTVPIFVDVAGSAGDPPAEPAGLADPYLSRDPVRLEPLPDGGIRLVPSARLRLAVDGDELRAARDLPRAAIERGVVLLLEQRIVLLLHLLDPAPHRDVARHGLVGESAALLAVRRDISQVAGTDVPVLLRGATGTGKELVARAIHRASKRQGRPFVAVNLGAMPSTLASAELFGAVKGAFTGADRRRRGCFERAEGGTLFLDEIGEAAPEVQVHLLRALETGRIQPVGAEAEQEVDVRVLAATDADLEEAIAEERFREPLLHRLGGYEIHLPTLAARRDDIGRLLAYFLHLETAELGENLPRDAAYGEEPWLPAPLVARLARCDWPGNVRQLRNTVRQVVIANRGVARWRLPDAVEKMLGADASPHASPPPASPPGAEPPRQHRAPSDVGENELLEALRANRFNLQATAEALGISRGSLYNLVERSPRIRKAGDLGAREIEESRQRLVGDLEAMSRDLEVSDQGLRRRMKELGLM